MKKSILCIAALVVGASAFAQDNEAEAALVTAGTSYWTNWYETGSTSIKNASDELCDNYLLWDSYWEVDNQTQSVQVLKGISPANGLVVETSSITNGNSYTIEYKDSILVATNNKATTYEKFGIRWMYWDNDECENYQLVNPITGQKWTNDCHKIAKGYSVDFSDPANRIIQFDYQLVSAVEDPSIRVDLWDIKGRKSSVSDGSSVVSHIKTIVEANNTYMPNDADSWHLFQGIFADPYEIDELEDYTDVLVSTIGDICDQAYWWNGVNFTINSEGYQAPFNVLLDMNNIIGLEFYINDEETSGKSTLYIKNLVMGNNLTRNQDQQTEYESQTAVPTIVANGVEFVDGIVYSEGFIKVYNVLGTLVLSGEKQLNTDVLPAGVYFVQTQEGTMKIVK